MSTPNTGRSFTAADLDDTEFGSITTDDTASFLDLWGKLRAEADRLVDGNPSAAQAVDLLATVCTFMARPNDVHTPYEPFFRTADGGRSRLPGDLSPDELEMLADILPLLRSHRLAARVADVLWINKFGDKPHEYARTAVENWLDVPVSETDWYEDAHDNWPRFLLLARQLKMTDLAARAKDLLRKTFDATSNGLALTTSDLMLDHIKTTTEERSEIAERLARLAADTDNPNLARQLHRSAASWFAKAEDDDRASEQLAAIVHSWVDEAESQAMTNPAVANVLLDSALLDYRSISNAQRQRLGIDSLGDDVMGRIRASGIAALGHMHAFESEPFDLNDVAQEAITRVAGRSAADALGILATYVQYQDETKIRAQAEDLNQRSPLASLFSTKHFASDGRTVYKSGSGGDGSFGYPSAIWEQMIRLFEYHAQVMVPGIIWPALQQLINEHHLTARDFIPVVEGCGIVPRDRTNTVARALAAGWNLDFTSALYLLVPQVENIVRQRLQSNNVRTSTINEDGIEQEIGLTQLLKKPEVITLFGPDIVFELRALFAGPTGPNLRNTTAHGLVSDAGSSGTFAVYAWWFFLRLIYAPYWYYLRESTADTDSTPPAAPDAAGSEADSPTDNDESPGADSAREA